MLARTKNTHGLNKVQSDFRVWDLQINPAWVSWGPGSGINCYISWPSSCCLSQPAWLGPGLARNHGLWAQQCGHFPQQKNTQASGVYRANKMSPAKRSSLPHFSITFSIAIFSPLCSGQSMVLWEGTRHFWVWDRNLEKQSADLYQGLVLEKPFMWMPGRPII